MEIWHFHRVAAGSATVLPDGCCDLILGTRAAGHMALNYSTFDGVARSLVLPPRTRLTGLRLRAGATLAPSMLQGLEHDLASCGSEQACRDLMVAAVEDMAETNDELIDAVASARVVTSAARRLGITARTLHRHLVARTGRPPSFWLDLARARRALRALATEAPLAEVAFLAGYADQAHLTRSFAARFGLPPGRFRADRRLMRLASQPGFAG